MPRSRRWSDSPRRLHRKAFVRNDWLVDGFVPPGATSVFEIEASRDAGLPIRKFAGDEALTIWGRTQRGENEEGSLAQAGNRRSDRIPRMD